LPNRIQFLLGFCNSSWGMYPLYAVPVCEELDCQSGVWAQGGSKAGCYYLSITGSALTYRGVGSMNGSLFSGSFQRTDRPGPTYYFGYHFDCRNSTSCAATRGPYVGSIGGSGSFHSIIHVANMPTASSTGC